MGKAGRNTKAVRHVAFPLATGLTPRRTHSQASPPALLQNVKTRHYDLSSRRAGIFCPLPRLAAELRLRNPGTMSAVPERPATNAVYWYARNAQRGHFQRGTKRAGRHQNRDLEIWTKKP